MGTIKTAMSAMGYEGPHERDCCKACKDCDPRPAPAVGQRRSDKAYYCTAGGFYVSPWGVCKVFDRKGFSHG